MRMYLFGSYVTIVQPFAGKIEKTRFLINRFDVQEMDDFCKSEKSGKSHTKKKMQSAKFDPGKAGQLSACAAIKSKLRNNPNFSSVCELAAVVSCSTTAV